jgi:hypothetical protein
MTVALRHPVTGQLRIQEEGWSWGCFLGSSLLGLPLFRRRLPVAGAAMLAFDVLVLCSGWIAMETGHMFYGWLSAIGIGASVYYGFTANGMALDRALDQGWEFAD